MRLLAIILTFFALFFCAQARTLNEIKDSGFLRVGVLKQEFSMIGYTDEKGVYHSYDLYLAARLASDLGVRLELVRVSPNERINYLASGYADIMLGNLTYTAKREKIVDFARPYMRVYLGIVSYQSAPIKNENDIPGKRLVVVKNTEAASWIKKYFKDTVEIIEVSDYFDALEELFYGRGDGLVVDNTIAIAWAADHEGYVAGMTKLGEPEVIAPAVQKGNHELLEWLNAELYELGDKGFFREAFEVTLRPKFQDAIAPEDVIIEEWRVLKLQ